MSSPQALIGLIRRYEKGISLTDGEIIYCLGEIERYNKSVVGETTLKSKLVKIKANLLAEKRSRVIDKII